MSTTAFTGQSRIRSAFQTAKEQGRCALLPFITGGYPSLEATEQLLRDLPQAGADLIEIGFPFSDPIADGPIIAESMHQALLSGTTPDALFALVQKVRPTIPMLAMVSFSIVGRMGIDRFLQRAVEAGFCGFIVPDADPTAAEEIARKAATLGAGFCPLVSPTTTHERLSCLAGLATGFVYLLARAGVTGERNDAPEIADRARMVRAATDAPIAAGFGISTAAHIKAVGEHADGAIVGSAIVRVMTEAHQRTQSASDATNAALDFVCHLSRKPTATQP